MRSLEKQVLGDRKKNKATLQMDSKKNAVKCYLGGSALLHLIVKQ